MKKVILSIAISLFCQMSLAQNNIIAKPTVKNVELEGRISFEKRNGAVCMALGCPKSNVYFAAMLLVKNQNGFSKIELAEVTSKSNLKTIPLSLSFKNESIMQGDLVKISGKLITHPFSKYMNEIKTINVLEKGSVGKIPLITIETKDVMFSQNSSDNLTNDITKKISFLNNSDILVETAEKTELLNGEFSRFDISEIKKLLQLAKSGQLINPNLTGIHCLAIPTHHESINGLSGLVEISSRSYPCGDSLVNNTDAGKRLLEIIQEKLAQIQK